MWWGCTPLYHAGARGKAKSAGAGGTREGCGRRETEGGGTAAARQNRDGGLRRRENFPIIGKFFSNGWKIGGRAESQRMGRNPGGWGRSVEADGAAGGGKGFAGGFSGAGGAVAEDGFDLVGVRGEFFAAGPKGREVGLEEGR